MSRDGSGGYSLPNGTYTPNTLADADEITADFADITTAIAASIAKDGQTTPTANLPMGGYKHTGVAQGTALTHYADVKSVQNSTYIDCGTAGGSKNALTLTPSPAITAYATGQTFRFKVGSTASDDAVTVAISGLATKAVEINDSALSASVVLEANKHYEIKYDGTAFQATRLSPSSGITASSSDTLTNKTIDADNNTITNIGISEMADAAKESTIPFIAGYASDMTGLDVAVQTYMEFLVVVPFSVIDDDGDAGTAPTGQAAILDIEKNGTTIYSSKPQFAAAATTLTGGTLKTDGTEDFAAGDKITFKVTQIGSSAAGQQFRFSLKVRMT